MNADSYLDAKEEYLLKVEAEIMAAVSPDLERTIQVMAAIPLDAPDLEFELALIPLNDRLRDSIAQTLFLHQREMSDLAVEFYPGKPTPMISPGEILEQVKMAGTCF